MDDRGGRKRLPPLDWSDSSDDERATKYTRLECGQNSGSKKRKSGKHIQYVWGFF